MSTPATATIAEDELMDLFASDTFSLESARDRDLMALSKVLQTSLPSSPPLAHAIVPTSVTTGPGASSGSSSRQFGASGAQAQWITSHQGYGNGYGSDYPHEASSNNGWRPDASISASAYLHQGAPTCTPSSSFNPPQAGLGAVGAGSHFGQVPPPPTPQGTPMSYYAHLPSFNLDSSSRNLSASPMNGMAVNAAPSPGYRAPAVSRERAPADIPANEWSSRLRSASSAGEYAIRPPSYEDATSVTRMSRSCAAPNGRGRQVNDDNDDAMMGERESGDGSSTSQGWPARF
ncbi:BQ5605_C004g02853 [Microbotryum silenes-dioicae]|uniref:BQ5605_C004g02853 protein n=1 Tax=Microbotryum silenes-dioicae TaxID=796604 RepID=A0A2X0M923_9BASI|nr:BQ5605_C004g02853 [Microbotryum silenes-dioicae]